MALEPKTNGMKKPAFLVGSVFLFFYWLFGFDGITFSDDVYYLIAGKKFWEGSMESNSYHFSTRWGAYIPSGLIGFFVGLDPHRISLISLFSYLTTLWLSLKILPQKFSPWILVLWFSTQVYFLHFLPKVYPDSLLVFWVFLVPFAAVYRNVFPFWSALGVISGLFLGFLTKEIIVLLAPFPFILLYIDWLTTRISRPFYLYLIGIGFLVGIFYLGYFWLEFGSPLYRFESIQNGHYISEFSYADKNFWVMVERLTVLPIINFVERAYWVWFVFAIPGIIFGWKSFKSPFIEFSGAFLILFIGFWAMSTTLRFYNPLYLNPRHLIILVPILAYLITIGWGSWNENPKLKRLMFILLMLGIFISTIQLDKKMVLFQLLVLLTFGTFKARLWEVILAFLLVLPTYYAMRIQHNLKSYPILKETLNSITSRAHSNEPILTNNFLEFSKEVLIPGNLEGQKRLVGIAKIDSLKKVKPNRFQVLLYDYYRHAYPKEQTDVEALEKWLKKDYKVIEQDKSELLWLRTFERK